MANLVYNTASCLFILYLPCLHCLQRPYQCQQNQLLIGTVDNHGNTETVISVKCRECRDFAKMPCFLPKAIVLHFHKNILFLISII